VLADQGPVALDVLVKLGDGPRTGQPGRPLAKLRSLLQPQSIAIVGVSESRNVGRIILDNLVGEGFPPARISVVKPNADTVAGVACYPTIGDLPDRVDLMVLSIAAGSIPGAIDEIIATAKAESVIVIPGGIGERSGTEGIAARVTAALGKARDTEWGGPLVNGGNCMGIRSEPGHYNTLFLPDHKLQAGKQEPMPLALISQSGAFAGSAISKLTAMRPRYVISVGNQIDLTVGDYLTYLKDDPDLQVFACYVEGFRPRDGELWLEAAAEITASGRVVILYRAGRTAAGVSASASHTASIAGDYLVTCELARGAGVVVADTLAEFSELIKLFCHLRDKQVSGWRLGAVSNAGFECVAIADNVGRFELHQFDQATTTRLEAVFRDCGIDAIVQVTNPVDLTPVMGDEAFEAAVRGVLEAKNVDVGIVGCVPLTGALNTLAPDEDRGENVRDARSIAQRLARLQHDLPRPWVAVVDGGTLYDSMALLLEEHGVPTFRTADRALRMLERFCRWRLQAMGPQTTLAATSGH
jgi:acyl-CoA synthetase (NDP forming)